MFKVLTLNPISKLVNNILTADKYTISDNCDLPNAILLRSFNMHDYSTPESVIAVARAGAGVNNIPLDVMTANGVCVFNTPGANANAVKELVLSAMILGSRNIYEGIQWTQCQDCNDDVAKLVEKGKKAFGGSELFGKTLGLVGLGAIGRLVANMAICLGMNVIGFDPFLNEEGAKLLNSAVTITKDIKDIYTQSNFISLHVPATAETKNSINASTIALMKDGVVIVNCARGELVNNNDIISATASGKVAKYVTDLPCSELLGKKNIITVPHLGASTEEAEDNCAIMASNQLKDYLNNGNIINSVNLPALSLERKSSFRAGIIYNCNSANCTTFSNLIAEQGVNVTACVCATRGNIGYCIIEADARFCGSCLRKADGVIKVNKFFNV